MSRVKSTSYGSGSRSYQLPALANYDRRKRRASKAAASVRKVSAPIQQYSARVCKQTADRRLLTSAVVRVLPSFSHDRTHFHANRVHIYATTYMNCARSRGQVAFASGSISIPVHDMPLPSVLWRCWSGGRKGIQPVLKLSGGVLAWLSVWSTRLAADAIATHCLLLQ